MKSVLMSIKPKWVAKILNGEKTIEIRKRFPKDYVGWVYIYCTKDKKYKYGGLAYFGYGGNYCVHLNNNKMVDDFMDFKLGNFNDVSWTIQNDSKERVVARFWCDKVEEIYANPIGTWEYHNMHTKACLTNQQLCNYLGDKVGVAIHITKLEIFDKPKEISEFKSANKYEAFINTVRIYRVYKPLTRAPQSYCFINI